MNQKMRLISGGQGPEGLALASGLEIPYAKVPAQPRAGNSAASDPEAAQALEKIKASLVFVYLNSNLTMKSVPLKAFLDGFEKKILLACLRLTQGNQKNAAALLRIKPTALFEKMRKHGIRSQRGRLPGEPCVSPAGDGDN